MSSLRPPVCAARVLAVALALVLAGCGTDGGERAASSPAGGSPSAIGARTASITGTVVDAESGAPLAGVSIEGPAGTRATSDERGRFTLSGLPVGIEGQLVARSQDGGEAVNRLRPLRAGALEVVLRLRRP